MKQLHDYEVYPLAEHYLDVFVDPGPDFAADLSSPSGQDLSGHLNTIACCLVEAANVRLLPVKWGGVFLATALQ